MPRVAVVQAEVAANLPQGLEQTADLARDARARGAELVVFPETWLPGYPAWLDVCQDVALWDHPPVKAVFARLMEQSVVVDGESGAALGRIARDLDVTLAVGVSERVAAGPGRGTLFNSLLTYDPAGRLVNHHRKLIPTFTERLLWGPGDAAGLRSVDTPAGRVGGLICWEHWMPLARQTLHQSGEDIHLAAWPMVKEMNLVASRHYAFEGRCFVLAAGALMRAAALPAELVPHPARVSSPEAWVLRGGSAVIAPDGALLAGPVHDRPCLLEADLELEAIPRETMALDVTGHYDRPDLFKFQVRHGRTHEVTP